MAASYRLPDGRTIRATNKTVRQAGLFKLVEDGICNPKTEGLPTVKQLDPPNGRSHVLSSARLGYWSNSFVFYRRGFKRDVLLPIGDRILHIEQPSGCGQMRGAERLLVAVLDLSRIAKETVMLQDGSPAILEAAAGMGTIPISGLQIETIEEYAASRVLMYILSVAPGFDPTKDLAVKDVVRPDGFSALVDDDGIPLQGGRVSNDVGYRDLRTRRCTIDDSDRHTGVSDLPVEVQQRLVKLGLRPEQTGWFGSIACESSMFEGNRSDIHASGSWFLDRQVVLVSHEPAASPI